MATTVIIVIEHGNFRDQFRLMGTRRGRAGMGIARWPVRGLRSGGFGGKGSQSLPERQSNHGARRGIMAGCSCGKFEKCHASRHPDTQSSRRFTQATPVLHMQRRSGETFAELQKRLAKSAPDT